jgi:membrane-associated HD superfamily phosphohydrolase
MIDNQVQQIQTLTDQLNQFENYEAVFGNPAQVTLSMVTPLDADLKQLEPGQNLENLVANADGNYALTYNDSGIFVTVGANFKTPGGQTVQRPADLYKQYAAINNAANNYVAVADDAAKRRATIKGQIAQTTQQLQNATTDAQVQKLHAVLTSLNADLASTDDEVNQAVDSAVVQDIQNRNDQQKQAQALKEQQDAAFTEAISNTANTFQLLDVPTSFPQ